MKNAKEPRNRGDKRSNDVRKSRGDRRTRGDSTRSAKEPRNKGDRRNKDDKKSKDVRKSRDARMKNAKGQKNRGGRRSNDVRKSRDDKQNRGDRRNKDDKKSKDDKMSKDDRRSRDDKQNRGDRRNKDGKMIRGVRKSDAAGPHKQVWAVWLRILSLKSNGIKVIFCAPQLEARQLHLTLNLVADPQRRADRNLRSGFLVASFDYREPGRLSSLAVRRRRVGREFFRISPVRVPSASPHAESSAPGRCGSFRRYSCRNAIIGSILVARRAGT
jgi:hypothetical protein